MDNRGLVDRGMDNRGSMIGRGSMVCWGSVIGWGRSVDSSHRECSRSNNTSRRLLKGTIAMYRLWGSMGLTDHRSMYSAMGLVDRVADRRSITMFDTLVVSLVCNSSHKGKAQENLHVVVRRVLIN